MKYTIKPTTKFQKDLKKAKKRGYDMSLIKHVIKMLADDEELPTKYKNHNLTVNYTGYRE